MTIKTIIDSIRLRVNDKDVCRWTNDDILTIINEAIRFVRNEFVKEAPTIVTENPIEGSLDIGSNVITVPFDVVKYIDVRVDGRTIHSESIHNIQNHQDGGTPKVFVPFGKQSIAIFPMPNKKVNYKIVAVSDTKKVAEFDQLPFSDDYQDCIIEYVAMRLSMIDEFDQTLETQLLAEIRQHIMDKLNDYAPQEHVVRSYY